ncbi:MAG TPA: ribosome-associated translation inhibitor RaiA [Ktedonobacteraceae bacterium]|nr:ribosome-associated translation inhibitor RaiA [Ktedonobacteraceae bacterium]
MQITIKSKQMDVSPRMRGHIEQKLQRLSRLIGDEARMDVTVVDEKTRSAKDRYAVHLELTNVRHLNPIRATASNINVKTALDLVLDKVTTQLSRQKGRHTTAHRLPVSPVQVLALSRSGNVSEMEETAFEDMTLGSTENEEIWSQIMEIRRVDTRPMEEQEVITQMEREGLPFYPFINAETNSVNVMYRLSDGEGYGLLVPATEQVAE